VTRAAARLGRLEAQAAQAQATLEARNTERVGAALERLLDEDLEQLHAQVEGGQPWPCPWEDVPPGLPEDVRAAWAWAGVMHSRTRAQVWPLPPTGAAGVFEGEAAKREAADPARLSWQVMVLLAQVFEAEG